MNGNELRDRAIARFSDKARKKFDAGAKEHGGDVLDLSVEALFNALEEEKIDEWFYLQALRVVVDELLFD